MARPKGPLTRNSNRWTEAEFHRFIKNGLRSLSRKWGPKNEALKRSRVSRGIYRCECCGEEMPASVKVDGRRKKNVHADHIEPVINPETGFTTWDEVVVRMFCEEDGFQILCTDCHAIKTNEERAIAKKRRDKEKSE